MSEEKNRNFKNNQYLASNSDTIPSFLLKTYEILQVIFILI